MQVTCTCTCMYMYKCIWSPSSLPSQATHPYFGRVSFSAGARFEAEAAFLQSHYWDKVVSAYTT